MRARRTVRRRLRPGVIGWSVLLLVGAATGCRAQPAAGPAAGVDVQAYHLRLRLDPETRYIAGRVRIDVAHADTVTALHLALAELQVDTVQVEGVPVQAVRDGDRLTVPLPAGRTRSRVEVAYQGVPPVGLYAKRVAGTPVVYTDSWPDRARGWLPSVDHPSDPATFALDLDVPLGYEVVANGREAARDTAGAYLRTAWRLEASAPTYTFAFAVSDFAVTETTLGDTLPVRYYMLAPDSARAALLRRTPASLAFFSERLGPYAFSTYAVVEIPIGFGGMENASVPFLNVELFTDPEGQAESVQVHEAAHQWFGNRVVIQDWQHLWLSEGVATYLTTWFYEQTDGLDAARTRWVDLAEFGPIRRRTHGPLVPAGPVDPNRFLTWVPYQKGASVLHVLRLRLGDEPFFAAVRRLYQAFAGQPLSTEQFQQTLEAESGEDLDALFEYWVYGDAVPTLQATWDAGTRTLRWRVDGDAGTLDGVPVELQLRQGAYTVYVPLQEEAYALPGDQVPNVRPVGVLMQIDVSSAR